MRPHSLILIFALHNFILLGEIGNASQIAMAFLRLRSSRTWTQLPAGCGITGALLMRAACRDVQGQMREMEQNLASVQQSIQSLRQAVEEARRALAQARQASAGHALLRSSCTYYCALWLCPIPAKQSIKS